MQMGLEAVDQELHTNRKTDLVFSIKFSIMASTEKWDPKNRFKIYTVNRSVTIWKPRLSIEVTGIRPSLPLG